MGTPLQVKKQVADAEKLAKELGMVDSAETAVAEQEAREAELMEAPTETPAETPAEPTETPATAEVVEITTAEPVAEPVDDGTDWKQKFKTLQGKYDTEMRTLTADQRTLQEQLNSQTAILASMQNAAPAAPAPEQPAPAPEAAVITATEVEDFGEDLLDVVGRKALLSVEPTLTAILDRLEKLEGGVATVQQSTLKTERDKVYDALNKWGTDRVTPPVNWRDINNSNEFKSWLREADPYAGNLRGALLQQAFEANDSARVVAFFAGYLKEQTTVTPDALEPSTPATPVPQAAQIDLETLVQPGGAQEATPASAHGDSAGRYFTQAEIAAFYADVQRGRYKGREPEKAAIEAAISDAANNGRVTG